MSGIYIVLMGVQGAGKGTQADILHQQLNLPHITTGGLFRAMKSLDTPLARKIQEIMNAGLYIDDETTNHVVKDRLAKPDVLAGALFDGYPRTRPQAEKLDEFLAEIGGTVSIVPFFQLDRQEAIARISDRWQSTNDSNEIYNLRTKPPKRAGFSDVDGAPLMQRPDDTPEAAAKRIDAFYAQTLPLLDFYRERGLLVEINADQPIANVTEDLLAAIKKVTI